MAASFNCFWTLWMIVLRSSPCSFPGTNCILIVLNAPRRRNDSSQYSTTWEFFSFLFLPFFLTLNQGYATQVRDVLRGSTVCNGTPARAALYERKKRSCQKDQERWRAC